MPTQSYKDILTNPNSSLTIVQEVLRDWFLNDDPPVTPKKEPVKVAVKSGDIDPKADKARLNKLLHRYKLVGRPKRELAMKAIQILHPTKQKKVSKRPLDEEEVRKFKRTFGSNQKYDKGYALLLEYWPTKNNTAQKAIENAAALLGLSIKGAREAYADFEENLKVLKKEQQSR